MTRKWLFAVLNIGVLNSCINYYSSLHVVNCVGTQHIDEYVYAKGLCKKPMWEGLGGGSRHSRCFASPK